MEIPRAGQSPRGALTATWATQGPHAWPLIFQAVSFTLELQPNPNPLVVRNYDLFKATKDSSVVLVTLCICMCDGACACLHVCKHT